MSARNPMFRSRGATTATGGFTLVEILLAVAVGGAAMVAVSGAFISTMRARETIVTIGESTRAGQRILTLLERDLETLWHFNMKGNRVFVGRNLDIGGYDADRLDFYTASRSVTGARDNQDHLVYPPICEVGYWLKENRAIPGLLELWRREDPMVDNDVVSQGAGEGGWELVSDRLKDFNITYYRTLGHEAEELFEWDSAREHTLPRRMKIEFTVHRKIANRNQISQNEVEDFEKILKKYTRHIVFDRRYADILQAGVAMVPIAPPPPEDEGPLGPAGPGGAGGGTGEAGDPNSAGFDAGDLSRGAAGGNDGFVRRTDSGIGASGRGAPGTLGNGGGNLGLPTGQIPIDLGDLLRGLGGNGGGGLGGLFGGLGGP